jgi:hypothetical protein
MVDELPQIGPSDGDSRVYISFSFNVGGVGVLSGAYSSPCPFAPASNQCQDEVVQFQKGYSFVSLSLHRRATTQLFSASYHLNQCLSMFWPEAMCVWSWIRGHGRHLWTIEHLIGPTHTFAGNQHPGRYLFVCPDILTSLDLWASEILG